MAAYALTIFIGAFLLFQAQPLIGKYILPWFGGAPGVWTTCLLFFQVLLLGGYAYAYLSARWLKLRAQISCHLLLLVAALALLPITPGDIWKPDGTGNPTLQILAILAVSLGLPYFVLSSTGPLMQHWFSRANPGVPPYRLYALSNAGSLLALVSFPFFFETHFTRVVQATLWGWGLVAYAVASAFCAVRLWRKTDGPGDLQSQNLRTESALSPSNFDRLLWLLLPACASVLLLATTNKMCQEVAVIPFLWVLPLALYLLSFIICFDNPRWYVRPLFIPALIVSWGVCWLFFVGSAAPIKTQLALYSTGLFICCMVCHGELYRLRPDPRYLTGFYLMIAAGGALGGLFVAVIAPLIFNDYFELQTGLLLSSLLLLLIALRNWKRTKMTRWRGSVMAGLSTALVALGLVVWRQAHSPENAGVQKTRNFYGVMTVSGKVNPESGLRYLKLNHGHTLHGIQFVDAAHATWPTTYYNEKSGIGLALQALPAGPRHIGLVGLGIGTLAAYGRPGDDFHFYEINPEVERIATSDFTYLHDCAGQLEITLGDARLSLEKEPPQNFDLLAIDAFNSDAIPVHLLTREAFQIYQRHLKPGGIIAVHVSNLSLNLEPVVMNLARESNFKVVVVQHTPSPGQWWIGPSVWMLLERGGKILDSPAIRTASRAAQIDAARVPLWTDDFASLFQILRKPPAPIKLAPAETEYNLANSLIQEGKPAEAIAHFQKALQLNPNYLEAHNNLAYVLLRNGNIDEAIPHFQKVVDLNPGRAEAHINLGNALVQTGRLDEAIPRFQQALQIEPDHANVHYNLGVALVEKDRVDEAIIHFQQAVRLKPDHAEAHYELGNALLIKGSTVEAIAHLQSAVQLKPDFVDAENNLAWELATSPRETARDGRKAVELARQANQISGGQDPDVLGTLAAAYAEVGQFEDARRSIRQALALAQAGGSPDQTAPLLSQLQLYEAGRPFHRESP